MLIEIKCDKFSSSIPNKTISFKEGLNCIVGGDDSVNSIGKSTLLLMVDYCFGGSTYPSKDIVNHLGHHIVYFTFSFGSENYRFARRTEDPTHFLICDQNYKPNDEPKKISELQEFLKSKYFPPNTDGSFRSLVSRFMRINAKNNCNVTRPLEAFPGEREKEGIKDFERLFDSYVDLKPLRENQEMADQAKSAFDSANRYGYVYTSIKNEAQAEETRRSIASLKAQLSEAIPDREAEDLLNKGNLSEEDLELASFYRSMMRKRDRVREKLAEIRNMSGESELMSDEDLSCLKKYFPSADVKELSVINDFQKKLIANVNGEILEEKCSLEREITELNAKIEEVKRELDKRQVPAKLSKGMVDSVISLHNDIDSKTRSLEIYEKREKLIADAKLASKELAEKESKVLPSIVDSVNDTMSSLNSKIYEKERMAPKLTIRSSSSYTFQTPSDTGTGTGYKSLILFDIAMLEASNLPVIIHDSLLYKNIWDQPVQGIFALYPKEGKQEFIAIDRIRAFDESTQSIIEKTTAIKLGIDSDSLFGFSWASQADNGSKH